MINERSANFGVNLVAETIKFYAITLLSILFICVGHISFDIKLEWFNEQSFIWLFLFNRASRSIRVLELVVGNISFNVSFFICTSLSLYHLH